MVSIISSYKNRKRLNKDSQAHNQVLIDRAQTQIQAVWSQVNALLYWHISLQVNMHVHDQGSQKCSAPHYVSQICYLEDIFIGIN